MPKELSEKIEALVLQWSHSLSGVVSSSRFAVAVLEYTQASMEPLPFRSGKSLIYIHVGQFHI